MSDENASFLGFRCVVSQSDGGREKFFRIICKGLGQFVSFVNREGLLTSKIWHW